MTQKSPLIMQTPIGRPVSHLDEGTKGKLEEVAKQCLYRVGQVAHKLGVSRQALHKSVRRHFGEAPHVLFARWRARDIEREVERRALGKQMLGKYGLEHSSSLSRALQRDAGHGLRAG